MLQTGKPNQLITLKLGDGLCLMLVLSLLLFMSVMAAGPVGSELASEIFDSLWIEDVSPSIHTKFGFVAGRPARRDSNSYFQILKVTPGGAFDRAGIRPGDIPARPRSFHYQLYGKDSVVLSFLRPISENGVISYQDMEITVTASHGQVP
jgi:hypothetical protein